jgi:hypothetical protein
VGTGSVQRAPDYALYVVAAAKIPMRENTYMLTSCSPGDERPILVISRLSQRPGFRRSIGRFWKNLTFELSEIRFCRLICQESGSAIKDRPKSVTVPLMSEY